jgi:hypothetical protein
VFLKHNHCEDLNFMALVFKAIGESG